MADSGLLAAALITSLVSSGLFLVGVSAWSTSYVNIINTAWSFFGLTIVDSTQKIFLGLRGLVLVTAQGGAGQYIPWLGLGLAYPTLDGPYINQCLTAGETAFSLTLVAAIFSVALIYITIYRFFAGCNTASAKFFAIAASFISFAVSVTAFANWHVQCYLAFYDNFFGHYAGEFPISVTSYEYYGFNVVVVGWIYALVSLILHILAPTGDLSVPATTSAAGAPEQTNQAS